MLPANFLFQRIVGRESSCAKKPPGKNGSVTKRTSLARENDENDLRNFLGEMRTARLAERGGINKIDVAIDQFGKRLFGAALCVILQQRHVIHHLHSSIKRTRIEKRDKIFLKEQSGARCSTARKK